MEIGWKDSPDVPGLYFREMRRGEMVERGWADIDAKGVEILAESASNLNVRYFGPIPEDKP